MKSVNSKRLVVYLLVLFALLAVPFLVAFSMFMAIPEPYTVSSAYLSPNKATFNLDALKSNPAFANVERLSVPGHTDQVLLTSGSDLVRLVMASGSASPSSAAEKADQDGRAMRKGSGATVVSEESSNVAGVSYLLTKFSDGSVSFTQIVGSAVLQIMTRDPARAKTAFREIGLLVENPAVSGGQAWLGRNMLPIVMSLGVVFAGAMLVWIFKGGCWVAAVDPRPNAAPVSASELKNRLLAINDLEVPFRISDKDADILSAEWRIDGKWRGLLESQSVGIVATIDMKLHPGRRSVSVIETQRKWNKEAGVFSRAGQFSFFRGITLASYDAGAVYGLSYVDGQFKVTGYQYRFSIQEMKNPLIEVVTSAGWRWEPHIFTH
jgi:hypothetical protein